MGNLTKKINEIRVKENLTAQEFFEKYPQYVEQHKDEMIQDWENNNVDNNPDYHLSYWLEQQARRNRQYARFDKPQQK